MKLNDNLVNHYGSLITIAFMAGSDGKEESYQYSDIELEYCNIIMDIKKGEKYEGLLSCGEVGIPIKNSDLVLPCGIYGRWESYE